MLLDCFDSQTPSRAFKLTGETQLIAGIVDGSGSWGSGMEAAAHCREELKRRWHGAAEWSASALAADIHNVASLTPPTLRDEWGGWSFSVAVLLAFPHHIAWMAAGCYEIDLVRGGVLRPLFRPKMLVDDFVASGVIAPTDIDAFPHKNVFLGSFLGDVGVTCSSGEEAVRPGDIVAITHREPSSGLDPARAPQWTNARTLASAGLPAVLLRA